MKKHSTLKEKFEIAEFLKTIIVKDGEFARYTGNWSDIEVSRKYKTSVGTVRGIRNEFFGLMRLGMQTQGIPPQVREDVNAILEYLTRKDPNWREG